MPKQRPGPKLDKVKEPLPLPLCPVLRRSTQLEGELHEHVVCKHRAARAACGELGVTDAAGVVATDNGAKAVHAQHRMLPAQHA